MASNCDVDVDVDLNVDIDVAVDRSVAVSAVVDDDFGFARQNKGSSCSIASTSSNV